MIRISLLTLALGATLFGQSNPLITEQKASYTAIKTNFMKAAEKMPEESYAFKPAPEVESFGQRVAHIANQIRTCSAVTGGEPKQSSAAGKTAKADLVAALKESFDACDAAWASITDANATEMFQSPRGQRSKLGALIQNTIHDNEVYGAMGVYMRLKSVVPPSSEGRR